MVSNYNYFLSLVRSQQAKFPNYPKLLDFDLADPEQIDTSNSLALLKDSSSFFVGTVKLLGNMYWEFAAPRSKDAINLDDYIFFYLELSKPVDKLPFYYTYAKNNRTKIYPSWNLLDANISNFDSWYTCDEVGQSHPLLPGFTYQGYTVIIANNTLLYEYADTLGLYGGVDSIYLSNLRPLRLNYPLDTPQEDELEYTGCYATGLYPTTTTTGFIGSYTGYSTTTKYSAKLVFYLYQRSDGTRFLLDSPPHPSSKFGLQYSLEGLPRISGTDSYLIGYKYVEEEKEQIIISN